MERIDFLKGIGLLGLGAVVPVDKAEAAVNQFAGFNKGSGAACTLIPAETPGRYPLDLSFDSTLFRSDIRETQSGQMLNLKLKMLDAENHSVIKNCRVDLWHCNTNGNYSGYTTTGHSGGSQNYAGQTWLRGIQMTDAGGEVNFTTIFPAWYNSRAAHIHFQVHLNSVLQVTSQFTFPTDTANQIFTTVAPYSLQGKGPDLAADALFSAGYPLQTATLTANAATGGYDAYLEVNIDSRGAAAAFAGLEPETGGQFTLGQNSPNPYTAETTIPFTLKNTSDVSIQLYDLSGRKVAQVLRNNLEPGSHELPVNMEQMGIASGHYIYQLHVYNNIGAFTQCKMMTTA